MVDILTFDGFFGAKFDILKPRWLPTADDPVDGALQGAFLAAISLKFDH